MNSQRKFFAGQSALTLFVLLCALIFCYLQSVAFFDKHPISIRQDELRVVLPETVQTLASGGDKYLAANIGAFRAMTLTTERVDDETYHVLGIIQRSIATLNGRHEDNYYTAQAVLPWAGEYDAALAVMAKAHVARWWDAQTTFFYAFDLYYFLHDSKGAADLLVTEGVSRSTGQNAIGMRALAAKWYEHVARPQEGRALLYVLRDQAKDAQLRGLIEARIARLDGLIALQSAADQFEQRFGHRPETLEQLVSSHMMVSIPEDPFGKGYVLSKQGIPEVRR